MSTGPGETGGTRGASDGRATPDPVPPSTLARIGGLLGAIGALFGLAAGLAVVFGPAPAMGLLVPGPGTDGPVSVIEIVFADPFAGVIALAWPIATATVGIYGGITARRMQRRHVLGSGVLLVFLVVLGPPAMVAGLPAAVSLLLAWALLAVDRVVRARRAARLHGESSEPP